MATKGTLGGRIVVASLANQTENDVGARSIPLCVDLDGTLINTDMLHEAVFMLLRRNILYVFLIPLWLLGGKANMKAEIAKRAMPDTKSLPFNKALLSWLKAQQQSGRKLILATASNRRYAQAIADQLKIFSAIEASDDKVNLSSSAKAC